MEAGLPLPAACCLSLSLVELVETAPASVAVPEIALVRAAAFLVAARQAFRWLSPLVELVETAPASVAVPEIALVRAAAFRDAARRACQARRMFVKICGLREPVTVAAAIDAGADAVGFVFAPGSPRTVDPATVRELVQAVPVATQNGGVQTVGVFRRQPLDEVVRVAMAAGVSTIQLHGDEPVAELDRLRELGFDTIRALSLDEYLSALASDPSGVRRHRLLVDAPVPGAGEPFDTTALSAHPPHGEWLLAGGLHPGNVAALITEARPAGVDVSSGVESSRGVKDAALIAAFVAAARAA
jgi:phosphoribosylanthranilate isomerase